MDASQLRALQAPLKERYRANPESARVPLHAEGEVAAGAIACVVGGWAGPVTAGLHPATGGDGTQACSGDMLLQALVACAGVTLKSVATAMGVPLRRARVVAGGHFDARGTLGVSKDAPVGLTDITLRFELDTDADDATVARLLQLTERYCVILQTLRAPPRIECTLRRTDA